MIIKLLTIMLLIGYNDQLLAEDVRIRVDLPAPARDHMMSNMRVHLMALESITRQLSRQQYDAAAEVAETRLLAYRVH